MGLGPGTLARVGQLYPSGGLCDYELQVMAPDGVQVLTTRVPFRRTGVADDLGFAAGVVDNSELLADAEVGLIAINCTAATMMAGSQNLIKAVHERTGIAAVTTIDAVLAALGALGVRRLALVTPYVDEVVQTEVLFLTRHGFSVARTAGRPCSTPVQQGSIPSADWAETVGGLSAKGLDGVLVSCAGIQIAPVIQELEDNLDLPVITSNQALLWWILQTLGISAPVTGYGRLFDSGQVAEHQRGEARDVLDHR